MKTKLVLSLCLTLALARVAMAEAPWSSSAGRTLPLVRFAATSSLTWGLPTLLGLLPSLELPEATSRTAPPTPGAPEVVSQGMTLTGQLEVLVLDSFSEGRSSTLRYLHTEDQIRYRLEGANGAVTLSLEKLRPNVRVTIFGFPIKETQDGTGAPVARRLRVERIEQLPFETQLP